MASVSTQIIFGKKCIDVNWGSSRQAEAYKTALTKIQQLSNVESHVKTYTPQVLVMTGLPNMRPSLVDFAYLLCKNNSLMVCADILKVNIFYLLHCNCVLSLIMFIVLQEQQTHAERSKRINKSTRWLRAHKTKAFYSLLDNHSFNEGVTTLLQATGIGKMRPDILLIGYQSEWKTCGKKEIDDYCAAVKSVLNITCYEKLEIS